MGAERQIEGDAAEVARERVDDRAPEVRVGQPAVGEDERRAGAALEVLEASGVEVD